MSSIVRTRAVRKSPQQREAEILDAARALALEGGLTAVTLRALAARIGVTPALIAHYRPSMDALVAETFTVIVDAELDEVAHLLVGSGTATDRLAALVGTLLDDERDDVTAVWVDAWSIGRRVEVIAAAIRSRMEEWQRLLREFIEEGVRAGEFSTDDADAVAWQLLGMIDGLNAHALVRYRDASSRTRMVGRALEGELGLTPGALAAGARS